MRRDVFQAIADPTRRDIINLIATRRLTPNTVANNFDVSRQAISKHIKILQECGLLIIEQEGRERFCSVRPQKLNEVVDWLNDFRKMWEDKFDRLDIILIQMKKTTKNKK